MEDVELKTARELLGDQPMVRIRMKTWNKMAYLKIRKGATSHGGIDPSSELYDPAGQYGIGAETPQHMYLVQDLLLPLWLPFEEEIHDKDR